MLFYPDQLDELAEKEGFVQMVMTGKTYKGDCYVEPQGIKSNKALAFGIEVCLAFNEEIGNES